MRSAPYSLIAMFVAGLMMSCTVARECRALEEPKGAVDWVGGFVQGIGHGTAKPSGNKVMDRLSALRAAEVMAQRALAETIQGVRVDGSTSMRDAIKQYVLESRVQGIVRGAQRVKSEVSWEGDIPLAMVELRVLLVAGTAESRTGDSLVGILATDRKDEPAYVPVDSFEIEPDGTGGKTVIAGDAAGVLPPASPGSPERLAPVSYDPSRPVTGLLLQTAGLRFERELFPVVVARGAEGKFLTVYSAKSVKPEVVRAHGVARFADTPEQAMKNPLLGDNPLVISVSEVTRENMLVIRHEGAKAVRETTRFGNDYLADAKVIVAGR